MTDFAVLGRDMVDLYLNRADAALDLARACLEGFRPGYEDEALLAAVHECGSTLRAHPPSEFRVVPTSPDESAELVVGAGKTVTCFALAPTDRVVLVRSVTIVCPARADLFVTASVRGDRKAYAMGRPRLEPQRFELDGWAVLRPRRELVVGILNRGESTVVVRRVTFSGWIVESNP